MDDFSHILNWKLLYGSHEFPGPDGGTCINEAAIVAAGFGYQRVGHARELPPCFCPVIGEFSVWLNDSITDSELRMKLLLPFVTRLAGARGAAKDEAARIEVLRAHLTALTPESQRRRRFTDRHHGYLLLGEVLGPWTVRRYSLKTARSVRELTRIAEHLKGGQSVLALPGFFAALARALDAMLAVGPRAPAPEAELLIARMEAAKTSGRRTAAI
jgi:hypothetical protein